MDETPAREDVCPCGGYDEARSYATCCGPFIEEGELPPTCEQLMRSRYTAFVVQNADHLWRTWHPRTRPSDVGALDGGKWLGLDVLDAQAGGEGDTTGIVEFVARYRPSGGPIQRLHERSRFERRAGRWFYVDGDELQ